MALVTRTEVGDGVLGPLVGFREKQTIGVA
jgi:hypothetical protein